MLLHVLAAEAPPDGASPLVLIGLVLVAAYLLASVVWPYAPCRACKGKGRYPSPTGRAWRNCRRCGGSGRRTRLGRRVWSRLGRSNKTQSGR